MSETPNVPGNNSLPQGTPSTGGTPPITGGGAQAAGGATSKAQAVAQAANAIDSITGADKSTPNVGEQVTEPQVDEEGNVTEPQYNPGDKIAPGMEVGEDGKVKQSAIARTLNSAGVAAGAYFGGAEGAEAVNSIKNSKTGQKLVGVVSDTVEKAGPAGKVVEGAAEEIDKAGVNDAIEGAAKALSDAKSGDLKGAEEGAKQVLDAKKKAKKYLIKKIVIACLIAFAPLIIAFGILFVLIAGIQDENDTTSKQVYNNASEYQWKDVEDDGGDGDPTAGGGEDGVFEPIDDEQVQEIIKNIPGWDSLSNKRKSVIQAALTAVGLPYTYGSKPSGPGLSGIPSTGLDCSGFVDWAYWTGLGSYQGFSSTANMVSNSSTWFNSVTYDQMKPGDVAVRRTSEGGHTAIYLGNDNWVHASGKKVGIIVKKKY